MVAKKAIDLDDLTVFFADFFLLFYVTNRRQKRKDVLTDNKSHSYKENPSFFIDIVNQMSFY